MRSSESESIDLWIQHAERSLYLLATELRRVPLEATTKRLHLRALELKKEVASWRERYPTVSTCARVLEEIEELGREAHAYPRGRAKPLAKAI